MVNTAKFIQALGLCLVVISVGGCGQDKTPTAGSTPPVTQGPTQAPSPGNNAPEVEVSARMLRAAILQLDGSVLDGTLPDGEISINWSKVSGPGDVEFGDPSAPNTTATFTVPGSYVLRLTASDGEFTVSDDVTVLVNP